MQLDNLIELIEKLLPPETAMEGDPIGLQVQSGRTEVHNIMTALEVTDEVIDEAVENKIDCIIAFHPLIFMPLKSIHDDDRVGRAVSKLIKNDISLITVHTAFDAFEEGTSRILAEKLNLDIIDFLIPDDKYPNKGIGLITETKKAISKEDILKNVHSVCNSPLRYNIGKTNNIKRIAILGGSGSSYINDAIDAEADVFITADVTYHKFHYINGKMMIIDPGHYEMEQFVPFGLKTLLEENLNNGSFNKIIVTSKLTNPVRYYPGTKDYKTLQNKLLNN